MSWIDAVNVTGEMTLPNTTTNWQTIYATTTTLLMGTGPLVLVIDSGDTTYGAGFFDYVTIYKLPPAPLVGGGSTNVPASSLSTSATQGAAQGNANTIQSAINSLGAGGGTVTLPAGTYYICQPNPVEAQAYPVGAPFPPASAALVSSQPLDNYVRSDSYWVGFQFTVGPSSLTVSNLGRWVVSGDSGSHTVELFTSTGGQMTTSAGAGHYAYVTVATSGEPTNQFVYAPFDANNSTVTLLANTTYAIMSQEGGDPWYDAFDNQIAVNGVATNPWAVYASTMPGSYTLAYGGSGKSYVPVSLLFNAQPRRPADNYAVLVCTNNITIQGTSPGTTLVAANRDTTVFYFGSGTQSANPPNSQSVTNILLQNITFQGNPTIDWAGFYCPTGVVWADSLPNWFIPLGSQVVFGGFWNGVSTTNGITNLSDNLVIQHCTFYNPSDIGVNLLWARDVLVTNCNFSYFNGINHSQARNFGAWCGVLQFTDWVQDVAVFNNGFNGNASMQLATDYAADGLVWLSGGGQWIAEANSLTNYDLEAVQFDAGPYTVVNNTYNTLSSCNSACALNTSQNAHDNPGISSSESINSTYCFVANNVVGGAEGIQDPGQSANSPYNLIVSANQFNLSTATQYPNAQGLTAMAHMIACQGVSVAGNTITNVNRAIAFQNYTTNNPAQQVTSILALCNDFANANYSSFFVQDQGNKLTNATLQSNRLGCGTDGWTLNNVNLLHLYLGVPANSGAQPYVWLEGNQFMDSASSPLSGPSPALSVQQPRRDYPGWVGCQFTVGSAPVIATYLGRWVLSGNTSTHNLELVNGNGSVLGSTTVSTYGQPIGQFGYAWLSSPVTLQANTTYYVASQEAQNGDYWYNYDNVLLPSGASVPAAAYSNDGYSFTVYPTGTGYCYGPVNFICVLIYPVVGNWAVDPRGPNYQLNTTGQYFINNPSYYADGTFSLF